MMAHCDKQGAVRRCFTSTYSYVLQHNLILHPRFAMFHGVHHIQIMFRKIILRFFYAAARFEYSHPNHVFEKILVSYITCPKFSMLRFSS